MKNEELHNVLQCKNLTIGYSEKKKKTIIREGLNLNLPKGKMVSLLGKNGIGKSTLLRTISKIQPAISGEIFLKNQSLEEISAQDLAKIVGLVLTDHLPPSNLSVFELIALGRQPYTNWVGKLHEKDIKIVKNALEITSISDLADKKYYQLSDGQLQKVMIARAIAQDTDIIILDEPTAHLDIHHKIETFQLLKTIVETTNKTVLISTHEVHLAMELSDILWLFTPDEFIADTTENCIERNDLEKLFSSDLIYFNSELKQFRLRK
ncbi:ABC transporter ATP-binding protein [Aureivirga marina]|uniref:ABC transporter ATP-binding protein n=1 Tax=Aureivirga marina TaxID=1182451 RepID=UPI0018CA945C|nr:ABC transporter ATP-binding protein [Aureivirga marina]